MFVSTVKFAKESGIVPEKPLFLSILKQVLPSG